MTLQCYTPTPSSSVEVTAQPADVLAVNYTHNTQLPIVSAAVHRFRRCEQNIYSVYSNTHRHTHTHKMHARIHTFTCLYAETQCQMSTKFVGHNLHPCSGQKIQTHF